MAGTYTNAERLIVKVGTGFLFDKDGVKYRFMGDQMDAFADEAVELSESRQLVIVSSGAIATAACKYGLEIPDNEHEKAQLAGMGQPILMQEYISRFSKRGRMCAQCLITQDDIMDRKRRRNLRMVQDGYFEQGIISIYNENDAIATDDITFGDNDILAAKLARCLDADLMVMLSNPVNGLGEGGGDSKEKAREILAQDDILLEIINGRYEQDETGLWKPKILELF